MKHRVRILPEAEDDLYEIYRYVAIEDSPDGAAAARVAGVPVVVTRSFYFGDAPLENALAVGPGLHTRRGWNPAPRDADRDAAAPGTAQA